MKDQFKLQMLRKYLKQINQLTSPSETEIKIILSGAKDFVDNYYWKRSNGLNYLSVEEESKMVDLTQKIWRKAEEHGRITTPRPDNIPEE